MSPEADKILNVYRARGLQAGAKIHLEDFGDSIVWEGGFVRDEPVRRALAELFEGGYLIEYLTALELTGKGERQINGDGKPVQPIYIEKLSELIQDGQAESDLRRYFGVGLGKGELPPFTGGRFEILAGGGDQPDVRDEFTHADLVAVELLGVRVPALVALDLLEGSLGDQVADYLRQIPSDVPLWTENAEHLIAKDGPADRLWHLLEGQEGVGWVTAGKLLARKRPALIPVYDRIVRCAIGRPDDFWTALRDALRDEDNRLLSDIETLMKASELPSAVTALRALDVVVWMHHRRSHTDRGCTGL